LELNLLKVLPPDFQMPWNKGAVTTVEALKIRQQELLQVRHFFDHKHGPISISSFLVAPPGGKIQN
jgi:hypothetical protein